MILYENFKEIVLKDVPLIDVRAPIEFEKGAFPHTINLPIMNNEEREKVGICYKQGGNEAASKLGYELVSGSLKETRIKAWLEAIENNPQSLLYCFRGGQRSKIACQWIKEASGLDLPRLEGGYKAFRNYLINELDESKQESKPVLLGGYTGSGKTILLNKLEQAIDLEGIANHRGSAFGQKAIEQPSPINFENRLAYDLIKHRNKGFKHLIIEDEGRNIGKRFLPQSIANFFSSGSLVILKRDLEERIDIIFEEYVLEAQKEYSDIYGPEMGLNKWEDYIKASTMKLKKRWGLENCNRILDLFDNAMRAQENKQDLTLHKEWIRFLLEDYYDPMYEFQIKNRLDTVIYEGGPLEVYEFLKDL